MVLEDLEVAMNFEDSICSYLVIECMLNSFYRYQYKKALLNDIDKESELFIQYKEQLKNKI